MLLILGTRNRKKCEEIIEILGDLPLQFALWLNAPEVVEDGTTFEANARKKAGELAAAVKHWVLAEDSGLVVPALGDRPGVHSARYAGQHGDDAANNARLLAELESFDGEQHAAYYVCTAALADSHGQVQAVTEGRCHGRIIRERRGQGGFGYDP